MSADLFPMARWLSGTNQNSIPANDNALRVEVDRRAALAIESSQPGTPSEGDIYILGASPTGVQWASFAEDDVVVFYSGTWYAFAPYSGWRKYNQDDESLYLYDGGWTVFSGGGSGATRDDVSALATSGSVAVDYALGDYFILALSGDVSGFTFSNLPGAGKGASLMIQITQDSTPRAVAWPSSFKWPLGVPGVVSTVAGAVDVLAITTFDNGTTWRATLAKAFA